MSDSCPDPGILHAWAERRLAPEGRARWAAHLVFCPDCRDHLDSLAEAEPEPMPPSLLRRWEALLPARRRAWVPYAAAAGLLAAVGLGVWKRPEKARDPVVPPVSVSQSVLEARLPVVGEIVSASSLREWVLGSTAEAALAPLSRGGIAADGSFHLEAGRAWVESSGDPVMVSVAGFDGILEVSDGAMALKVDQARPLSLLMGEAWAGEEGWGITVVRGTAKAGDRILSAGESLGLGAPKEDFRGWTNLKSADGLLKEGTRTLLSEASSYVAELTVRKRQPEAEGALRFRSGGKGWELLLGAQLPASGWVRLRVETSPDRLRFLAGGRECLSRPPGELQDVLYPSPEGSALSLKAWGGDLEIRDARWRP